MNTNKIFFCLLIAIFSIIFHHAIDAKELKEKDARKRLKQIQANPQDEPLYPFSQVLPASQQENFDKETISQKSYLRKPKTFKTPSAYDICKQECRRQRDEESEKEYVERLRDELKFAEEQLILQQKEREQNAQIQPSVASQDTPILAD